MDGDLMLAVRLFEEIEPLDERRRTARLANERPDIAVQVRALLDGAARRGVLDGPPPSMERIAAPPVGSLVAGDVIGPFKVHTPLGMGGMGEVFLAEREGDGFTQRVALKLLRIDAAPNATLFARERRLLSRLEHPVIARLIDGGITPEGRSWMAMDYIDGQPLDQWCAAHQPSLDTRLDIFARVADAVVHAHTHLVIHRDIKPSNVMIDAEGRPHLLDFGIAKLIGEGSDAAATTQALITPDYAAPEQFDGGPITTATDVHALGGLLFELLTGHRPWESSTSLPAIVRRILAEEPPLPSAVASATRDAPVPAARLRGDLDAIVAQAMRRDPSRRYQSVAAMLDDIARARALRPVRARQGSRRYRLGRYVRRNRVPLAAAAAVVAAVGIGTTATAVQAHRAAIARDQALAEARRSDAIVQNLTLMLSARPGATDRPLKETLDAAATRMLSTLDHSERSGQAVNALGDLLVNLADAESSFALYKGALDRGIGSASAVETARMRAGMADGAVAIGQEALAAPLLDAADRVFTADPDRNAIDHQQVVQTRAAIARRKGDYDRAIALLAAALPGAERAMAGNDSALLTRYNNMLVYMIEANRLDDMPAIFAHVDRVMAHPGARDTIQAIGIDQIRAAYLLRRGDAAAAERAAVNVVARRRQLFGDSMPLAADLTQLGKARIALGNYHSALAALSEAEPMAARHMGPNALPTLVAGLALAQAQAGAGEVVAARATLAKVGKVMTALPLPPAVKAQYALSEASVRIAEGDKPAALAAAKAARDAFSAMGPAGANGLLAVAAIDRKVAGMH